MRISGLVFALMGLSLQMWAPGYATASSLFNASCSTALLADCEEAGYTRRRTLAELSQIIARTVPLERAQKIMENGYMHARTLSVKDDKGESFAFEVFARPGDNREYLRKTMCVGGSAQAIEICLTARETLFGGLGFVNRLSYGGLADWCMDRRDLLMLLRAMYPHYSRYLEIGCGSDRSPSILNSRAAFTHTSYCVDPGGNGDFDLTSDEFFRYNTQVFDVIFVDGLHHDDQVLVDVHNALKWLAPGGVIVMHDCMPRSGLTATKESSNMQVGGWNGDVWRAVLRLRAMMGMDMIVVDIDEGCALIRKLPNRQPLLPPSRYLGKGNGEWPVLDYEVDFMDQEVALLRVKTVAEAAQWLEETYVERDTSYDAVTLDLQASWTLTPSNGTQANAAVLMLELHSTLLRPTLQSPPASFSHQCFAIFNQELVCRDVSGALSPLAQSNASSLPLSPPVMAQVFLGPGELAAGAVVTSTWLWDPQANTTCCTSALSTPLTSSTSGASSSEGTQALRPVESMQRVAQTFRGSAV